MIKISISLIARTVQVLHAASDVERVVLWLGRRGAQGITVSEVYVPVQETEADYFRIPPKGMEALLGHLRDQRLMVAAQLHTHPHEAFHSPADDRWAIVRHVGALSLVIPDFCQHTSTASFVADAKVFCLTDTDEFVLARAHDVYEVTP
jgi:proteasome lid subunit RPN8/RPN11